MAKQDKPRFVEILKSSLKGFFANLILPVTGFIVFLLVFSLSLFSRSFASTLQSTYSNVIWAIAFSIMILLVNSFAFAGIVGVCKEYWQTGKKNSKFFTYIRKSWIKVFVIMLAIYFINYNALGFIPYYTAFFLGKLFSLSSQSAIVILFLMHYLVLITISLFLVFPIFFAVMENKSIFQNIKDSFTATKRNYPFLLGILVMFFVIDWIISKINYSVLQLSLQDAINFIILLPFACLIISKFLLSIDK